MKTRIITDARGRFCPQYKGWFGWGYYKPCGYTERFDKLQEALNYINLQHFEPEVVWESQ